MTTPDESQWTAPPPPPAQPPATRHGRGKAVAIGAAAVVVLGGGIATYAAVSSGSGAGGSATPTAAVQKLFRDMNNSDLLGMLDDLPPGERDALVKPFEDSVAQLERIGVLKQGTDLNHISGVHIHASNLTFAPQTVTINDHVQVVKLTGGTLSVDANAAQLPLAGNLLHALEAHASGPTKVHHTVNIGAAVRRQGKPIRIATQKVNGQWYPSLLYTIADNVTTQAGLGTPNPADAIPARGANSPDDAVRGVINALLAGRVEQAIELTSPDEDAALHDYGTYIVDRVHYHPAPVTINSISFTDTPISGGTLVALKAVTVTIKGHRISVVQQGKCTVITGMGPTTRRLCPGQLGSMLPGPRGAALRDLMSGSKKTGIVTSESGGKWYIDPIRTVLNFVPTVLSGLTGKDLKALMHGGLMGGPLGLLGAGPMVSASAHGGAVYRIRPNAPAIPLSPVASPTG